MACRTRFAILVPRFAVWERESPPTSDRSELVVLVARASFPPLCTSQTCIRTQGRVGHSEGDSRVPALLLFSCIALGPLICVQCAIVRVGGRALGGSGETLVCKRVSAGEDGTGKRGSSALWFVYTDVTVRIQGCGPCYFCTLRIACP